MKLIALMPPLSFIVNTLILLFSHLADGFIQSDLQIRKSN